VARLYPQALGPSSTALPIFHVPYNSSARTTQKTRVFYCCVAQTTKKTPSIGHGADHKENTSSAVSLTTCVCWNVFTRLLPGNALSKSITIFYCLSKPGGPAPRIDIPQEQAGPVIPPGTGFPFRRLTTRRAAVEVFKPASTQVDRNLFNDAPHNEI
jgi:hypothetical protein